MIDEEGFKGWLMFLEETIQQLFTELPPDVSQQLDFTTESLVVLESWLLSRYDSPAAILNPSENWYLDRVSKYVGETIRRVAGGNWEINLNKPKYAFYRLPVTRLSENDVDCPASMVTASLDRRRGNYIKSIVQNIAQRYSMSRDHA